MNWFKRLCLSEQYRLATLGTLRRRLPDDPWRVRPHAPVTDTQNRLLSCGPEAIIYARQGPIAQTRLLSCGPEAIISMRSSASRI